MDNILYKLINAFGGSGHENEVREIIKEEIKDVKCEIRQDKLGNLIVKMGQGSEKIMVCAHMDTVGFMTTYIQDDGFLRVGKVGEVDFKNSINNIVRFESGLKGKLCASKNNPEERDLFIDLCMENREEVLKEIKEGDVACLSGEILERREKIIASNLDRIGVYVLLKVIKEMKDLNKEVYFVFSTQKELGGRGARAAAFAIEPDYCIVLDCEDADDTASGDNKVRLGNGPVVSIMDRTLIIDNEIKKIIDDAAEKAKVKIQYNVSKSSTDGGCIHKEVGGIKTGVISIPCRYKYTSSEVIHMKDIKDTIELINTILL
ncbi:M42 family peptidase [Haloimpatiens sp. FM7330]|uniref:M42 family peptidase n=1 Tax=Haloimpatiens sp. FM7330 TaxID=3298610 RepID=UPI0036322C8E